MYKKKNLVPDGPQRNTEYDAVAAFGDLPERLSFQGPSPFKDKAMLTTKLNHSLVGGVSVTLDDDDAFLTKSSTFQRRPMCNSLIRCKADNYRDVLDKFIGEPEGSQTKILAHTGAGKSTKFPVYLHERTGLSVLVIEPNYVLAANAFGFMRKAGASVGLLSNANMKGKGDGVVYTTANVALSLAIGKPQVFSEFGFIYVDEAHDLSGAYYALRVFLFDNKPSSKVIFASATMDGLDDERSTNVTAGRTRSLIREIEADSFIRESDVSDPWHYNILSNRCMIFVNTAEQCREIASWYTSNGVYAHVLTESTTAEEYARLFDDLYGSIEAYIVVTTSIAETGITLPIDVVVDLRTKVYSWFDFERLKLCLGVRPVTAEESAQRAGRVARLGRGTYFAAKTEYTVYKDIDPNEKFRAYLWIKLLGYKPLNELFGNEMKYLEPITRKGCLQLLSCALHPALSRKYLSNDGRFYANFSAIADFIPSGNIKLSHEMLDVNSQQNWFDHEMSHPRIHGGKQFKLRLPLHPESFNLYEMLHLAFEEVKWHANKTDRQKIRSSDRHSAGFSTNRQPFIPKSVEMRDDEISSRAVSISRNVNVQRRDPPKQEYVYPAVRVESPFVGPTNPTPVQYVNRPPSPKIQTRLVERPRMDQRVVPETQRESVRYEPTRDVTVISSPPRQRTARMWSDVLVQPADEFPDDIDFLVASNEERKLVAQLLAGKLVSSLASEDRTRYHYAVCKVWNSSYSALKFAEGNLAANYENNGSWLERRKLTSDIKRNKNMKDRIITLEHQFIDAGLHTVKYIPKVTSYHSSGNSEEINLSDPPSLTTHTGQYASKVIELFYYSCQAVATLYSSETAVGCGFVYENVVITAAHVIRSGVYEVSLCGFNCETSYAAVTCQLWSNGELWVGRINDKAQTTNINLAVLGDNDRVVCFSRRRDGPNGTGLAYSRLSSVINTGASRYYLYSSAMFPGSSGAPIFSACNGAMVGIHIGVVGAYSLLYAFSQEDITNIRAALSESDRFLDAV